MQKRLHKIIPLVLGVILVLVAVAMIVKRDRHTPETDFAALQQGVKQFASTFRNFEAMEDPARVTEASVIYDAMGQKVSLTSFAGKIVVINLWATWCAPCVKELPSLAKLQERRPDIEVLAVSLDLQKSPDELAAFLNKNNAGTLAVHTAKMKDMDVQFPNRGLPTTYILTSSNRIIYKMEGDADWSSDDALTFLDYVHTQKFNAGPL